MQPEDQIEDGRRRGPSQLLAALVAAVVIALVAGLAGYLLAGQRDALGGELDEGSFQAVVLSNDRVYFGRMQGRRGDFYLLTDVYFLRETPGAEGEEAVREVLPLSAELQQPENRLLVHEAHLVVVENLDRDSEVLRTIERLEGD